jgi:hypothetical protein
MPYPLNNFTTTDSFSAASEAIFSPPKSSFAMIVTNAAIYYQIAPNVEKHPQGATYLQETFAPPGRYIFDESDSPTGKISLCRVRSAVAGTPAQVTIS